jgi:two-component system sensor histidine kinase AlgZ
MGQLLLTTNQTASGNSALPDFRNLAVVFRIAALAEILHLLALVLIEEGGGGSVREGLLSGNAIFESVLLSSILVFYLLATQLSRFSYRVGCVVVTAIVVLLSSLWSVFYLSRWPDDVPNLFVRSEDSVLVSFAILWYFNWRHRVLSPALTEARLMALQARIRPHFLFNSLNTVLGLMRSEPARAETVLENLAELFRALMSEPGALVPLVKELELAKSYAEVETVRLGDRLTMDWQCQNAPMDALVPSLILQPLLENAVYHGIEPDPEGGRVSVTIFAKGDQLNMVVRNPCLKAKDQRAGNRMALNNIRERLDLHFDAEATLRAYEAGDEYVVQIRIPYRHGRTA